MPHSYILLLEIDAGLSFGQMQSLAIAGGDDPFDGSHQRTNKNTPKFSTKPCLLRPY